MTIGARLQALRRDLGRPNQLTQTEMARLMGTSLRAYQNYERDERQPQMEHLLVLYGRQVNINWLLSGEGEPFLNARTQSVEIDPETLSAVISVVAATLEEANIALQASALAEVISLVYTAVSDAIRRTEAGEANNPAELASVNLERLLPLVLRISDKEGDDDSIVQLPTRDAQRRRPRRRR